MNVLQPSSESPSEHLPGPSVRSGASAAARLLCDHDAFTASLDRIRDFAVADDTELLKDAWNELETALLRHMDGEEAFLLPDFAPDNPAEAERLLAEHAEIRAQIGQVGLAVDLHVLQLGSLDRLYRELGRHISREARTLYPWAAELRNRALLDAALRRMPDARVVQ